MILSSEDRNIRQIYKKYFLLAVQITDYNVMIDGRNFFDQSIETVLGTYENI